MKCLTWQGFLQSESEIIRKLKIPLQWHRAKPNFILAEAASAKSWLPFQVQMYFDAVLYDTECYCIILSQPVLYLHPRRHRLLHLLALLELLPQPRLLQLAPPALHRRNTAQPASSILYTIPVWFG